MTLCALDRPAIDFSDPVACSSRPDFPAEPTRQIFRWPVPTTLEECLMKWFRFCLTSFALVAGMLMTDAASAELKVGDAAPNFELPGSDGKTYRLSDLKGKTVVIAWYPKAFTGG